MRQIRGNNSHKISSYLNENEDEGVGNESIRDSLESSEVSSTTEAFNNRYSRQTNNFNQITQYIQNNNNKITIIIKHDSQSNSNNKNNNSGPSTDRDITPQIIYIQPASSQPNLVTPNSTFMDNENVYNSLDDLDSDEHYQFYNESAIDVPDDFKRDSYLVLNLSDGANKKLRRRICTPTRNLLPTIDDYHEGANDSYSKLQSKTVHKKEAKKVRIN